MPQIEWDESYSVQNAEIDKQHKRWIELINDLHNVLIDGDIADLKETHKTTLKAMRDYVKEHFAFEEEYMKSFDYPDLEEHMKMHDRFFIEIAGYYDQMDEGKFVLNTTIMKALMKWLQDHIMVEDRKYSQYQAQQKY